MYCDHANSKNVSYNSIKGSSETHRSRHQQPRGHQNKITGCQVWSEITYTENMIPLSSFIILSVEMFPNIFVCIEIFSFYATHPSTLAERRLCNSWVMIIFYLSYYFSMKLCWYETIEFAKKLRYFLQNLYFFFQKNDLAYIQIRQIRL